VQLADVAAGIGGFVMDGDGWYAGSGESVSGAGDVNGDGLADVVVASPNANTGGSPGNGRTYVVFGRADTDRIALEDVALGNGGFALDGQTDNGGTSNPVSGAGDVDGDGLDDVIVGVSVFAPSGIEGAGRSYVVFGKSDTDKVLLADVGLGMGGFTMDGVADHDISGATVSGAGDVNGDGLADVVVCAPFADPNGLDRAGRAYVVFGKADTDPVLLADVASGIGGFALDGEAESDMLGTSASGGGDVNGDGLADVVVGAHRVGANGLFKSGRTYVVFGKEDTDVVSLADVASGVGGFAVDGEAEDHYSGVSVSNARDVNGDGLADVVVGAVRADPTGENSGRSYVVFGKADTDRVLLADVALGVGGFAIDGEDEYHGSGRSVSGAGDMNGDGLADVIVAAPGADPNGASSGRAYVVFGKEGTAKVSLSDVAQGIGGFVLDGQFVNWAYDGMPVSGAGDVNGDGIPDVMVGAPYADPTGQYGSGRTYVVFGGDFSCGGG